MKNYVFFSRFSFYALCTLRTRRADNPEERTRFAGCTLTSGDQPIPEDSSNRGYRRAIVGETSLSMTARREIITS